MAPTGTGSRWRLSPWRFVAVRCRVSSPPPWWGRDSACSEPAAASARTDAVDWNLSPPAPSGGSLTAGLCVQLMYDKDSKDD